MSDVPNIQPPFTEKWCWSKITTVGSVHLYFAIQAPIDDWLPDIGINRNSIEIVYIDWLYFHFAIMRI